jgi:plasmid stabilization system protein ParE
MAKRKIIWSNRAKIRLFEILDCYLKRNKSKTYSIKLYRSINKEVKLLLKHPDIGLRTTEDSVRGLIVGHYFIFYEVHTDNIIIHTIWDTRQDPDSLTIK